jgi:hypothetical protein
MYYKYTTQIYEKQLLFKVNTTKYESYREQNTRSYLKNASEVPWRGCESAQNSHILPCMLRFFAAPHLALNPDSLF